MSYISSRDTDVFVSFADEDNAVFPDGKGRWTDTLAEYLRKFVEGKGITDVTIRTSVPGNLPDLGRLDSLNKSALVLLVLSPAYVRSPWFEDSRCRDCLSKIATEDPDRLFVAYKGRLDVSPGVLQRIRRHDFWYLDGTTTITLGEPVLLEGQRERYYRAVTELASALVTALKRLKACETGIPMAGPTPTVPGARIYLAEVSHALTEQREAVRSYMEQVGIEVAPRGLPPDEDTGLRRFLQTELSTCRAFVQLLGEQPNNAEDEATAGRSAVLLDAARTFVPNGLKILQWRSPSLALGNVAEPAWRTLLQQATVSAEPLNDFCHAVRLAASVRPHRPSLGGRPIVFVDVQRDQVLNAKRIFIDRYMSIAWDLNEVKKFGSLRSRLDQVRGVIMFWGAGDSSATVDRYYEFLKRWKTLKKRDELLCIYDGPPPDKPEFAGGNFPLIVGRSNEDPEELRRFVHDVLSGLP